MSSVPVKKNHFHEIDILYALGTILAILGHSHPTDWSTFPGKWVEFIYFFHMPLFFWIAGFLLASSESIDRLGYGKWVGEKALRLLTPYVILSVIALIPKYILEHGGLSGLSTPYLVRTFLEPRQGVWGHFWFLQVLFAFYVIFGLIRIAEKKCSRAWIYVIRTAMLAVTLVLHFLPIDVQWFGLGDICDFAVYFWAGYILYDWLKKDKIKLPAFAHALISAVLLAVSICVSKTVSGSTYRNFLICIMMLVCCWGIGQLLKERKTRVLDFISSFVFTFYIYSWPAQAVVEKICSMLNVPWCITTPAMFATGMLFPTLVILIYRKCKFIHCRFMDLLLGMRR